MMAIRYFSLVLFLTLGYVSWYRTDGKITEMAPNGIGFKHVSKYYKIVGPMAGGEDAFKEQEELEKEFEAKEETDEKDEYEVKLQKEENEYLDYVEQRKLAKERNSNPDDVQETNLAKKFEEDFKVNKSRKRRRRQKNKKSKNRSKRFAVQDPDKYWDLGIVPYKFKSSIKDDNIMGKLRAKNRFHYWTCIRFVPWESGISDKYGLNHDNYLDHIEKNGCWSFVGNLRSEGQKISCCKDDTCVHELGHALGLHHEQKSPMHDDYVRINHRNIEADKMSGFSEVDPEESRTFGYFDMASAMLYNKYAFSTNGMETMTLFDSTMEYLVTNPDPHNFYMFKEITDLYNCKDLKCKDFSVECKNGGFVAYIRGQCTCRCPKGLDPESGCTTVYKGDKNLQKISWPSTEFTLMKPKEDCPDGFAQGSVALEYKKAEFSEKYDIGSTYKDDILDFQFCTRTSSSSTNNKSEWEPGQYCILSSNGFCPEGFSEGFITFGQIPVTNIQKPIPDGTFSGNSVMWHFCCREDGSWKDPLYLPTNTPFTLFPRDEECQKVKDMKEEKQWFMVGKTDDIEIAGMAPNAKVARKSLLFINVCYYWPLNFDCGGVIELSESNPIAVVKSPNFPKDYNMKQECTWTILSPEHSRIKLDFESFNIEATVEEETLYPTCEDSLEIRYTLPGQPGVNYCGRKLKETIVSEVNYLGLTLFSGLSGSREGFKAIVKLISDSDMCYTNKGEDYRGTVNVTRLFEPCLPWTQVQHCPHHAFQQSDLDDDLVDNYCRNPGSGTKPWCYTHYEDCNRNYCDPCRLESCHDLLDDCDVLIAEDSRFCNSNKEAHRICRQSCGFCSKAASLPVSKVTCPPPPTIEDANVIETSTGNEMSTYNVGDTVTLQCRNGKEKEVRVCLSDGSWSGGNFVCGRCPNGWIPFKYNCYKWFGSYESIEKSRGICRDHSADIAPAKDSDEFHFLLNLRRDARSFWLGLKFDDQIGDNVWLEDGTKVSYNEFASGHSKGCAFVNKDNEWKGIACDQLEYMAVICKMRPSDRKICRDAREDCIEFIRQEPGACETYKEFAWHVCPKSCNQCNDGSDNKCAMPSIPDNVEVVYKVQKLFYGTMIEYKCKDGFLLLEGDLRRTCLSTNVLSGSEPVCLQQDLIPTANNDVELRQRTLDGDGGTAYTADNEALRITRTGKLVSWQFYSVYDGEVALQVWRKTGKQNKYKLIGQNIIRNSGSHRTRKLEIPPENQIAVEAGDMVGFYLPKENQGGLTFDKCVAEYTFGDFGNQKEIKTKIKVSSDWKIGDVYNAEDDKGKDCKIISLRAYVM